MRVAPVAGTAVQDHVALAEIELCGDLIIAASAAHEERLSPDRIDEVLRVTTGEAPSRSGAGSGSGSGAGSERGGGSGSGGGTGDGAAGDRGGGASGSA
ncbi:hypothetical protein [Streptomyces tsukubensis]|uniref:Uncharacterized protein n=1 Tax=Streptomyces tsukubensis TaxID=83656 RepID=A0A1V4A975_9ACTN|nr:hypothetical protein [Streptomyces tsukubensis]OON78875.1 hypothetical protein B1H18_16105 [Streptomyces tsukubensis]QFR94355.1 hypothetical protein GBW32_16440 [Streptomyces tsukubensis]